MWRNANREVRVKRYWFLVVVLLSAAEVQAADWPECESAKREAVRLQQALRDGRKLRGYNSGAAMKKARRSRDEWLRKNCRSYSRRLRDVERSLM